MLTKRTIVPGQIEGFLAGCPFCAARSKGPPGVGARFRLITGLNAGKVGTVVKVVKLPSGEPIWPYEIIAQMDDNPPHIQRRILFKFDLIQVLPEDPVPKWAPPLCLRDAAELDHAVVEFCEKSCSVEKWHPNWPAFYEIIRIVWNNRLPLEPGELWSVLEAHGVLQKWKRELSALYEKGREILIYCLGKRPVKKKRVTPLSV
jgi:hypothetical protein